VCLKLVIVLWILSLLVGISNVYEKKRENPKISLCKIINNEECLTPSFVIIIVIMGIILITGFVYSIYTLNI
jgi:hypothetical protein